MTDLIAVIRGAIVPPSQASPEWAAWRGDKSIEKICMSALHKTPDGRLPSALALADALTAWLGEAAAVKPSKRKSWFWGIGVLVLTGLAAIGTLLGLVRQDA